MPTPTENIFLSLEQENYAEIMKLIKANKSLINAVSSEDGQSLLQSLLYAGTTEKSLPLIMHIVAQPEFNFGYFNEDLENTNLDDLVTFACLDVFKSVIRNPNILVNKGKLTYQTAKEHLILVEASLSEAIRINPNSNSAKMSKQNATDLKEIIAYLRDATILRAIEKDDASLFDSLVKAGDDPTDNLTKLSKKYPVQLLTESNTNIREWLKASREKSRLSTANNPYSLYSRAKENERLENALVQCKEQYVTNLIGAKQRFLASSLTTIEGTIAAASASAVVPPGSGQSR
ncbi:MAG: hypothetical protein P4L65_02825 [Legionella sp.]|nr:hypothetical protein [Legionella sp.]